MNGEPTGLLNPVIKKHIIDISTESIFSGLAWRLRSKKTDQSQPWLFGRHLRNVNNRFGKKVGDWLDQISEKPSLGITQLEWSAGAAKAFTERNIPYLIFITMIYRSGIHIFFHKQYQELFVFMLQVSV